MRYFFLLVLVVVAVFVGYGSMVEAQHHKRFASHNGAHFQFKSGPHQQFKKFSHFNPEAFLRGG